MLTLVGVAGDRPLSGVTDCSMESKALWLFLALAGVGGERKTPKQTGNSLPTPTCSTCSSQGRLTHCHALAVSC